MQTYLVTWSSKGNITSVSRKLVRGSNLTEAQNKFWWWLQVQPIFPHMWNLEMQIEKVEE